MEENTILFRVTQFEGKYAILQNQVFGEIKWPIKKLPDQIEIGSNINLIATEQKITAETNKYHNQDIKNLLQELIEK